ncbi:MAG: MFS transporter, partial [Thermoplasmata archaeon]
MEASAPGARSGDEDRSPFALPNFRRLWSAFALSVTGYAIGNTTLLWLVFDRTHDPYAIALLGIAGFVPVLLFGVFAGALADRYERRRLMITADLVRAACIGALPITYLVVGFSLPIVLAIVFVLEAFGALFRPASNSLLPQVVPARKLDAANGYLQAANSGGGSIGSLVAGALIALVGAIAGLALNSVTFVASALLLSLIVVPFPPRSPADDASRPARRSLRQDVAEGVAFLRGQRGLLYGTFAGTALNFFSTLAAQFLVVYVSAGLGGGGLEFGALMAAFTLGIMVGALTASSLHLAPRLGRVVVAVSV